MVSVSRLELVRRFICGSHKERSKVQANVNFLEPHDVKELPWFHSTVCKEQNIWSYRVESVAILRVSKKKNGTKEESKRGHTHQVCHLNHKINTSEKTLDLTIWIKNGPPKVSYQFKTLSLKLSYLLMLAITECRDWAVLLKKQPSGELKPVPQGRISRSKKNMECCHVQIKKKGFGSYEGPASYSTWIHSSFFFFFSVFRPETMSITTNF